MNLERNQKLKRPKNALKGVIPTYAGKDPKV